MQYTEDMDCPKEYLATRENPYSHIEPECESKSSEGGYGTSDESDYENPGVSGTVRSASLSSNDAGYISCEEQTSDSEHLKVSGYDTTYEEFKSEHTSLLSLFKGMSKELSPELKVPIDNKPEWLDMDKFRAGQKFALDHYAGLSYSMMLSLFVMFSFPKGLEALIFTDKSSTPFTSYKRYLSTAFRVKSWFEYDLWSEGNPGYQNIKAVRAMHISVSKKMNGLTSEELKDSVTLEGSTRQRMLSCPIYLHVGKYFGASCPASKASTYLSKQYNSPENKIYFNQTEMSTTQFAFFGLMLMYPEHFGAGGASDVDLENYVHLWRGIGYLLGVEEEFNFCRGSLQDVKERCHDLIEYIIKPIFPELSKDWEHMSRCAYEGSQNYVPFVDFETSFAYLCFVMGIESPEYYSSLTWRQYFQLHGCKVLFRYVLRIPGVMARFNRRIDTRYERQRTISPERLERYKNRRYNYENEDALVTRL